jgi:outer membrane cobalamin receptor
MKAIDETTDSPNKGRRLIYRPERKLDIMAGFNRNMISANLHYQIVGKQFTNADNSRQRDDYQILNGNIGFHFTWSGFQCKIKAEAFNLLNREITILEGYPLPGREFRFSIGLQY